MQPLGVGPRHAGSAAGAWRGDAAPRRAATGWAAARMGRLPALHRPTIWRAALVQGVAVAVLAVALAALAPRRVFVDWGWLVGPAAWAICALVTARVLALPALVVLAGAAVSGVPSALAVLAGVHWLGTVLALGVFAAWCGALVPRRVPVRAPA